jgi:sec-independent protein translocase protein TatB
MFGIGMPEMILILAIALIVIGPKKLPEVAKSLGRALGEFKKATMDLKESMEVDRELKAVKKPLNVLNDTIKETTEVMPEVKSEHKNHGLNASVPDSEETVQKKEEKRKGNNGQSDA